jgi:GntR family transcriptional regulator, transcriptional repressor for pyruvate dehydrogenase complex
LSTGQPAARIAAIPRTSLDNSTTDLPSAVPAGPSALPRRDSASAEITRHLLSYLLSGDVTPGQKIPSERQLADALEVGRSAVREAIKSLSLLGLLDVRQGDGTYLAGSASGLLPRVIEWGLLLGERAVTDLMEARTEIEISVAALAAERADADAVDRIAQHLSVMRSASDLEVYVEADIAFHVEVARASGNEVLANLIVSLQSLLQIWARRVLEYAGETETSLQMHEPILDAIRGKDAPAAREAMAAHMARANRRLREAVAQATAER